MPLCSGSTHVFPPKSPICASLDRKSPYERFAYVILKSQRNISPELFRPCASLSSTQLKFCDQSSDWSSLRPTVVKRITSWLSDVKVAGPILLTTGQLLHLAPALRQKNDVHFLAFNKGSKKVKAKQPCTYLQNSAPFFNCAS